MSPTIGHGRARFAAGATVAAAALTLDQGTKQFFLGLLVTDGPRMIEVLPVFNLAPNWNYGVSFGMFNPGHDGWSWAVIALTGALTMLLIAWMWRAEDRATAICLGMVTGGALGNLLDRLRLGAVFDFLDFHAGGWRWPTFNFADVSITLGVVALLLSSFRSETPDSRPPRS